MHWSNFHTHTEFCDGSSEAEEYVKEAIKRKMSSLGFSGHAPVPFENVWSMKYEDLDTYRERINTLKEKYKNQINIYLSLEVDYIPGITTSIADFKKQINPDYVIGGIHLVKAAEKNKLWFIDGPEEGFMKGLEEVFDGNIKAAVTTFFRQSIEMLQTQKPDIIAHFDKVKMHNKGRFFTESEDWYQQLLDELLDVIEQSGVIVEVNTRGIYTGNSDALYPCAETLKKVCQRNIPITISADAHKPKQVCMYFEETAEILKNIGFKYLTVLKNSTWQEEKL
jgi:histidinol-phosphatase (PHP family)